MSSCIPAIQPAGSSDTPPPRTLVLCFDGTGDQFDEDVRCRVFMLLNLTNSLSHGVFVEFECRAILLHVEEG